MHSASLNRASGSIAFSFRGGHYPNMNNLSIQLSGLTTSTGNMDFRNAMAVLRREMGVEGIGRRGVENSLRSRPTCLIER